MTYNLDLEFPTSYDFSDVHFKFPNFLSKDDLRPVGSKQNVYSGTFNTGSRAGFSKFEIMYDGDKIFESEFEIFPSKMDYKQDFESMMQDIIDISHKIAFDFDRSTYLKAETTDERLPSDKIWFNIMKNLFDQFEDAFRVVAQNPKRKLETREEMVRPSKVRQSGPQLQKWLRKNADKLEETDTENALFEANGTHYSAQKLPEERKENTYDTIENRFLKHVLEQSKRRLNRFKNKYVSFTSNERTRSENQDRIDEMNNILETLTEFQNYDFIERASRLRQNKFHTLALQMAPGYKSLYKIYFLLQKGLKLNGEAFELHPKDISELYEYWCFLKIVELLHDSEDPQLSIENDEVFQVTNSGIKVSLSQGQKSEIFFQNEENGDEFRLYYNWRDDAEFTGENGQTTFNYSMFDEFDFPEPEQNPTKQQKPDILIELRKNDPALKKNNSYPTEFKFILDAKYKNEDHGQGNGDVDTLGPKSGDIDTMHRYRDAIISELESNSDDEFSSKYLREAINAIVLFPIGNDNRGTEIKHYQNYDNFFRSIGEVGIGGLPFLPNTEELVESILQDWVKYHPEQFRDRRIRQLHPEEIDWYDERSKDVLVGTVPPDDQKERWRLIKEENYYHMPASRASQRKLSVDYLAFFFGEGSDRNIEEVTRSDGHIPFYVKVENTTIVKRKKIPIPSSRAEPNEPYVKFEIKDYQELDNPIINTYGDPVDFRFGTLYTLKRANTLPELYITDPSQQKRWRDIKNKTNNARPLVEDWNKDQLGNYTADIEFLRG